mmetsp:Transcript_26487/g.106020  ORF Transcript_26487/g.106020 Transcript_26487/m.106020 type:complete len:239 (-) Transcript_26487:2590-3306(-)
MSSLRRSSSRGASWSVAAIRRLAFSVLAMGSTSSTTTVSTTLLSKRCVAATTTWSAAALSAMAPDRVSASTRSSAVAVSRRSSSARSGAVVSSARIDARDVRCHVGPGTMRVGRSRASASLRRYVASSRRGNCVTSSVSSAASRPPGVWRSSSAAAARVGVFLPEVRVGAAASAGAVRAAVPDPMVSGTDAWRVVVDSRTVRRACWGAAAARLAPRRRLLENVADTSASSLNHSTLAS